jgi:hypothetical protein
VSLLVSLVSAAAGTGTPTFTQDFTDSGTFAGATPKAAIVFSTKASANNTTTLDIKFTVGFVAGSNQAGIGVCDNNAVSPNSAARASSTTQAYSFQGTGGTTDGDASATLIANGLRLSWTDQSAGEIIKVLLIGGTVEAAVSSLVSNNGTSAQSVTHGLTGTPDFLIALSPGNLGNNSAGNGAASVGLGFWTAAAQNTFSNTLNDHNLTTVSCGGYVDTTHTILRKDAGGAAVIWTGLVNNAGSSTFDITYSAAHTNVVYFLAVRGTSNTLAVKTGTYATPLATGNQADVSGMSASPVAIINIPSRMPTLDSIFSTTNAGCTGLNVAVKNTGSSTTQYAACSVYSNDATLTSTNHGWSRTSNDRSLEVQATNGNSVINATVNSWDSAGVTQNYAAVDSIARYITYLAIGENAASVTITSVDTDGNVYDGQTGVVIAGAVFGAAHTGTADVIISPTNNIADAAAVTQVQTAWSATSVQITANLASFGFFTNLYLFIRNSSGASNASGFVIQREARARLNITLFQAGSAWASQTGLIVSVRASSPRGTELIGSTTATTNGSGVLQSTYYTLTSGGPLAPSDPWYVSVFKDDAVVTNTRSLLLKQTPTYE